MANSRFSYAFVENVSGQTYTSDWNQEVSITKFNFQLLPAMTAAEAEAITTILGAIPETDTVNYPRRVACPEDPKGFKPRRVKFIRRDGSSIQLVIPNFAGTAGGVFLTVVDDLRDAINAVDPDNLVVCVQLVGEFWRNIYDRLRTNTAAPTAGTRTIQRQEFVSRLSYQRQAGGAIRVILPYSIRTDTTDRTPPTDLQAYLGTVANPLPANNTDCVTYAAAAPCPGKSWIDYRRFIVTRLVTPDADGNTVEDNQVPVTLAVPATIRTCGTTLANLESALCLAYQGENHARLHQLLP